MKLKRHLLLGRKVMTKLDSILKSRDITLPTKVHLVKAMVFPVVMYGCENWDCKESWAPKNWCFWTVVLEKTPESPLDYKEVQPVHPKGNQSWIFIGRTGDEAEIPILWPPDMKTQQENSCLWPGSGLRVTGPYGQSYGFSSSRVWMWELDHKKKLSAKELMRSNCAGEGSWESLGLQGDQTSQS